MPSQLVDIAIMGAAMARIVFDLERPTVGLLNVGTEEIKGIEAVKEAGRILREANLPHLDYHGFVEGDDIGKGTVDVVVTEGFTGNIALKTAEGTARQIARISARRHEPHADGEDRLSVRQAALSRRCATRWIRARSMAACSSASTASSSRAMAAPTRSASRAPSTSPTTWRSIELMKTICGHARSTTSRGSSQQA